MSPNLKLATGASLVAATIGYLAYLGAASSWQYYLSVDEAVDDAAQLSGKRIRVSGRVVPGTLKIKHHRREATLELSGERHRLNVLCRCALPDNLAENIDIVVEGTMHGGGIHSRKVITRCASKYQAEETATVRTATLSTRLAR
jgi:cytochrome c-type biogenesis protein CcmE